MREALGSIPSVSTLPTPGQKHHYQVCWSSFLLGLPCALLAKPPSPLKPHQAPSSTEATKAPQSPQAHKHPTYTSTLANKPPYSPKRASPAIPSFARLSSKCARLSSRLAPNCLCSAQCFLLVVEAQEWATFEPLPRILLRITSTILLNCPKAGVSQPGGWT